jgi:flagellar biosynthetic protein FlhB
VAEAPDKESKTEEATPKRIEDALAKGNTPFSREIAIAAGLLAIGLGTPPVAAYISRQLSPGLHALLDRPGEIRLETAQDVLVLLRLVVEAAALTLLPALLALLVVGVIAAGVQHPPRLVLHRIAPDVSRISPASGWRRIASADGLMEFVKSLVKIAVFCIPLALAVRDAPARLVGAMRFAPAELPAVVVGEIARMFVFVGGALAILAAADLLWTRLRWRINLRMSPQELKEEHRQSEGDPIVRARQRSIARDRARRRMMSKVPRATLVVANPTHYAVALRYVHGESAVPLVLAKGTDHIALRIRAIAEHHGIPVIEDRALARSLHDAVRSDQPIPVEYYKAIAEIITFLMSRGRTQRV